MIGNLTGTQIILIIIAIIIIIWFFYWLTRPRVQNFKPNIVRQQIPRTVSTMPSIPSVTTVNASDTIPENQQNDILETQYVLYYFFNPNCVHCKRFTPTWNDVSRKIQNNNNISLRAVDSTKPENENISFYYNITGFPTVILVTPREYIEYRGNRTTDDLQNFISSNTN